MGSVGLITSGLLGYVLMLTSARRMVKRFVDPRSLSTMESLFDRGGAWAIILTRSLPYSIPEAMVFLAGLVGLPIGKFTAALAVGSVPTAFAFAAIAAGWAGQPILALVVSYCCPSRSISCGCGRCNNCQQECCRWRRLNIAMQGSRLAPFPLRSPTGCRSVVNPDRERSRFGRCPLPACTEIRRRLKSQYGGRPQSPFRALSVGDPWFANRCRHSNRNVSRA